MAIPRILPNPGSKWSMASWIISHISRLSKQKNEEAGI